MCSRRFFSLYCFANKKMWGEWAQWSGTERPSLMAPSRGPVLCSISASSLSELHSLLLVSRFTRHTSSDVLVVASIDWAPALIDQRLMVHKDPPSKTAEDSLLQVLIFPPLPATSFFFSLQQSQCCSASDSLTLSETLFFRHLPCFFFSFGLIKTAAVSLFICLSFHEALS